MASSPLLVGPISLPSLSRGVTSVCQALLLCKGNGSRPPNQFVSPPLSKPLLGPLKWLSPFDLPLPMHLLVVGHEWKSWSFPIISLPPMLRSLLVDPLPPLQANPILPPPIGRLVSLPLPHPPHLVLLLVSMSLCCKETQVRNQLPTLTS